MDRELVLAILVALLCGSALLAAGGWPIALPAGLSGRALERRAWRRVWLPFWPALLLFAALCGWALVEPADAEPVPNCLLWSAVPFAAVLVRALWRAFHSLPRAHEAQGIVTVGLLRPQLLLSPRLAERLDERALNAACEHERAHAHHHDPLRLWLAQVGTDLLWPWPAAAARLRCWRAALELARDEEARLRGVEGPDIAAAILMVFRFYPPGTPSTAAALGSDAALLERRIARLMLPLEADTLPPSNGPLRLLVLAGVILAVLLGSVFGEHAVRTFLAVV
jgi:hypothetical protein